MTRKIAIYGKGGIGKSTTTQNTAAAMAHFHDQESLHSWMRSQGGFDPAYSRGKTPGNLMDVLREDGAEKVTNERS